MIEIQGDVWLASEIRGILVITGKPVLVVQFKDGTNERYAFENMAQVFPVLINAVKQWKAAIGL